MGTVPGNITRLLTEARKGSSGAASRLSEIVYRQLHAMARRYVSGERLDHTKPTVLMDEAFVRPVEVRFFAGLPAKKIAPFLDETLRTVRCDWHRARLWLHSQLAGGTP